MVRSGAPCQITSSDISGKLTLNSWVVAKSSIMPEVTGRVVTFSHISNTEQLAKQRIKVIVNASTLRRTNQAANEQTVELMLDF